MKTATYGQTLNTPNDWLKTMHYDLIVIGMGLSGLMAAKTAVEAGQKVLIVAKGMGSLCLFSNTIDLLGSLPKGKAVEEGIAQWIKDHPDHPYSKTGPEKIEQALSSFLSLFPPPYSFQTVENGNCLIPTGAGTFRPSYLVPNTMVAGTSLKEGSALIVGFKGFKDFYAHYVADRLRCRGVSLILSKTFDQEVTAAALARLMEKKSFRENIGGEIRKQLHQETHVGFPAILGIHNPFQVREDLEKIVSAKVFEIPILPPSIPGIRIFNRFKEWLIQKEVTFLQGYSVPKAIIKGKRCEGLEMIHPPVNISYSADRYILATGRFMGGGLVASDERIDEPIFTLPVAQPKSREDWFRKSFLNYLPHPVHEAGILTDASFRPTDENGNPILENVWAAGSILARHHCIDEKSREGIEIATGYAAAKEALKI
jgi:glycerol-3-phosphate dehydrogenase subunit B